MNSAFSRFFFFQAENLNVLINSSSKLSTSVIDISKQFVAIFFGQVREKAISLYILSLTYNFIFSFQSLILLVLINLKFKRHKRK